MFRVGSFLKKYDLYHETNYIPMKFEGPTVVTIFVPSFHFWSETHPSERIKFMERYFYPRLSCVNHFITISEVIKGQMVKHLGI